MQQIIAAKPIAGLAAKNTKDSKTAQRNTDNISLLKGDFIDQDIMEGLVIRLDTFCINLD
jgi:hypothetical protein